MQPPEPDFTLPLPPAYSAAPPFGAPQGVVGGYASGTSMTGYTPMLPPKRSGLAVAAMVCGICSVLLFVTGIVPLLALIFGLISASSIKRSNGALRGLGMARSGWILGGLGVVGFAVFVWAAATGRLDNDDSKRIDELAVADCLINLPGEGATVAQVTIVDCAKPHEAEVYFIGELDPTRTRSFPGDASVSLEVGNECLDRFEAFVGLAYNDSVLEAYYLQPNELGWKVSRGGYTCFVYEPGKSVIGSLRDAAR